MFGLKSREKTIQEALSIIDEKIKELQNERTDIYVKLEGHAKANDKYDVCSDVRLIQSLNDKIDCLDYLRIDIEYM